MKSILNNKGYRCFFCEQCVGLHTHHAISGTANRRVSDAWGLTVLLCPYHHEKVHRDRDYELVIKQYAERKWIENFGTEDDFRKEFGKSWLTDAEDEEKWNEQINN